MYFLKVIGQHKNKSELLDVWVECDLLGPGVTEQVMDGKMDGWYKMGMRAHKLILQCIIHKHHAQT
jgi:hypothetical protein